MSKSPPVARKTTTKPAAERTTRAKLSFSLRDAKLAPAPSVKASPALRAFAQAAEADLAASRPVEADPHGKDAHAPGAKLDAGKPLPWLMMSGFSRALAEVAKVTTVGAQKYTKNGWASVPEGEERYMEAFGRHLLKLGGGEAIDHDTKCLHKAQMIWNLMASLELELRASEEGAVNVA